MMSNQRPTTWPWNDQVFLMASWPGGTSVESGKGFNILDPEMVVPQNGWFIMENPRKMDEFGGTTI